MSRAYSTWHEEWQIYELISWADPFPRKSPTWARDQHQASQSCRSFPVSVYGLTVDAGTAGALMEPLGFVIESLAALEGALLRRSEELEPSLGTLFI
jgi:hypothetical protein